MNAAEMLNFSLISLSRSAEAFPGGTPSSSTGLPTSDGERREGWKSE